MPNARSRMSETARLAPVRFRGGGFVLRPHWYGSLAAFVLIIALWQAAGSFGWISPLFLPSPFAIVQALIALAASGELVQHIAASAMRIGIGWARRHDGRSRRRPCHGAVGARAFDRHLDGVCPVPESRRLRSCRCSSYGWASASLRKSRRSRSASSSPPPSPPIAASMPCPAR